MPVDVVVRVSCQCLCTAFHPIRLLSCAGGEDQTAKVARLIREDVGEPVCYGCYAAIAMQDDPRGWPETLARNVTAAL